MELLNWVRLFENRENDGKVGRIVFFTKENKIKTYPSNQEWESFLEATNANVGSIRVLVQDVIVFLVGVSKFSHYDIKRAAAKVVGTIRDYGVGNISFYENNESAIEGFILGNFSYDFIKMPRNSIFVKGNPFKYQVQNFARFLSDTPANLMTPTIFSEYAKAYLEFCGINDISIYGREEIKKMNMNLFLSVSNGSIEEPKLIYIKYRGVVSNNIDLALVGKGITFDAGGISLKSAINMRDMKADMMGAAAVLSAVGYASYKKFKINVDVIIPLSENLPSGSATKPGDVYTSLDGKSVEIENTDAEGRLILADALTLAQKSKPTRIIDVATLTGSIFLALGTVHTGLFANDEKLAELILKTSNEVDDPCWRMPICEEYLSDLKSETADLQNTGGKYGGSIKAALFLKQFVSCPWAHLDIAGVMNESHDKCLYGKGMTGRPVRLLIEIMEKIECEN